MRILGLEFEDTWGDWIAKLPPEQKDIHYTPALYKAYEKVLGWKACLALLTNETGFTLQPFLRDGTDIRHAFNFGGPLGSEFLDYAAQFDAYKKETGIKHESCTLHPLICEHQQKILATPAPYVKDSVYIDLTEPIVLRETHRQLRDKARKAGVQVIYGDLIDHPYDVFDEMYHETMARRDAANHWRYPKGFFATLAECLGWHCRIMFARLDDDIECGCVLIHGYDTAYYHYAASAGKHPKIGAGHLLVYEAAISMLAIGYKKLFLGGGVEPNDGLFLFKSGFSKQRAPVYRYEWSV